MLRLKNNSTPAEMINREGDVSPADTSNILKSLQRFAKLHMLSKRSLEILNWSGPTRFGDSLIASHSGGLTAGRSHTRG